MCVGYGHYTLCLSKRSFFSDSFHFVINLHQHDCSGRGDFLSILRGMAVFFRLVVLGLGESVVVEEITVTQAGLKIIFIVKCGSKILSLSGSPATVA